MGSFFAKFLATKFSGWLALIFIALFTAGGTWGMFEFQELRRKAAYCEGQLATIGQMQGIQDIAVKSTEKSRDEVIEDVEEIRELAEEQKDNTTPPLTGCAAERAPDAVLRYHGMYDD